MKLLAATLLVLASVSAQAQSTGNAEVSAEYVEVLRCESPDKDAEVKLLSIQAKQVELDKVEDADKKSYDVPVLFVALTESEGKTEGVAVADGKVRVGPGEVLAMLDAEGEITPLTKIGEDLLAVQIQDSGYICKKTN